MMVVNISVLLRRVPLTFERRSNESDFDFTTRVNNETVDQLLRAGATVDPNSGRAKAALLSAIANGQEDVANKLINAGIRVDYWYGGRTLLALDPSDSKQKKAILQLVKLGANVNADAQRNDRSYPMVTTFSRAIESCKNTDTGCNNTDIVQALIDAKFDVNKTMLEDSWEDTSKPLAKVLKLNKNKYRLQLVKMLLAAGAQANGAKVLYMNDLPTSPTPLMLIGCDSPDSAEVVRAMIVAGADPNSRNRPDSSSSNYQSNLKYYKSQTCPYKDQVISVLKQYGAK